jgi:hypothetical protein
MRRKGDHLLAIGTLLFCAFTYFVLIPTIPLGLATDMYLGLTPRFFPKFIIICMAILAGFILIKSYLRPNMTLESRDTGRPKLLPLINALIILIVGFLYIYLLEWVGYMISTPPILAFYLWYFGVRSWMKIGLSSFITTGVLYYFFGNILNVLIPSGKIF